MFVLRNLFEELVAVLQGHGKSWEDVQFVGIKSDTPGVLEIEIPKDEFEKVAKQTYYNGSEGLIEIPTDLVVVGDGWHVERAIMDGGVEVWRMVFHYTQRPKKKAKKGDLETLNVRDVVDEYGLVKVEGMAHVHELNPRIAKKIGKMSEDVKVERKGHFIVIHSEDLEPIGKTDDKDGGSDVIREDFPFS